MAGHSEIALRMRRRNAPPVIREDIEDTKDHNEEYSGPLGFKADCNHSTGSQTEYRYENTSDTP
ncbi:hypothetical protein WG66_011181 [Moniliophthora roreri]|nr:hypothetical protein WG66_011181 [Moniliophthora roreri]